VSISKVSWKKNKLRDVCDQVDCVNHRKESGYFNYIDIGSIDSELNRIAKIQEINWNKASSRARQIIKKNDTLFSTVRVNLGRVALVEQDIVSGIASTGFTVLRASVNLIDPLFLFYCSITPIFLEKVTQLQVGTAYPAVTDKMVFNQEIHLPPLDEQQRIVELFQGIEQCIQQAQEQEKNLKALQKSLSNGLVNHPPAFGNLLSAHNCNSCLFGQAVNCIEEHDRSPLENGLTRFVGLENIQPENFALQGFGNIAEGTTFTKRFSAGDVLFGKRRAYLKKVAISDYDGICSSDILVFRAIDKTILPELLPYYVSSDAFMDYAVSTSAGSLSPRTKWRDLANFQLFIPDIQTQEKIVVVLKQLRHTLELIIQQKENLKALKQKLLNEILG